MKSNEKKINFKKELIVSLLFLFSIIILIYCQLLTKNQILIYFLIPLCAAYSHCYVLKYFNNKYLVYFILTVFIFATAKYHIRFNEKNANHAEDDVDDDISSDEMDEVEAEVNTTEEKTSEKASIKTRINQIQKIALWVQQVFEKAAHWGECVKNIAEFKVPFLSWIVVAIFFVSGLVVYLIPLR